MRRVPLAALLAMSCGCGDVGVSTHPTVDPTANTEHEVPELAARELGPWSLELATENLSVGGFLSPVPFYSPCFPYADIERRFPNEVCQLRAARSRCHPLDACLLQCMDVGGGENVGGGCWHVCYAYHDDVEIPGPKDGCP